MENKDYTRRTAIKSITGLAGISAGAFLGSSSAAACTNNDWDWENPEWTNQDDNVDLQTVEEGGRYDNNGILGEITDCVEQYEFKHASVNGNEVYEVPFIINSSGVINDPDGDPMQRISENWIDVRITGDEPVSLDFSPNDSHMGTFAYANASYGDNIAAELTETAIRGALAAASLVYWEASVASIAADLIFDYEYNSNESTYDFLARWNYRYNGDHSEEQFSSWACFFIKLEPSQQTSFKVTSEWRDTKSGWPTYPMPKIEYEVTVTAPSSDCLYTGDVTVEQTHP